MQSQRTNMDPRATIALGSVLGSMHPFLSLLRLARIPFGGKVRHIRKRVLQIFPTIRAPLRYLAHNNPQWAVPQGRSFLRLYPSFINGAMRSICIRI